MLTSEMIKARAKELGAAVCGIGKVYDEPNAQRDPKSILPNAKCIIGFGLKIPYGLIQAMENKQQYYNYTNLGIKYIDEDFAEIFLLKMGALIENEGYDACLQRSIPGFRIKGDKSTNPEVKQQGGAAGEGRVWTDGFAPSICAASWSSFGTPISAAVSKMILKPVELHTKSTNMATR